MKVVFQFNETELSINDFTDKDIPKVEQYFSNPFYKGFPYKDFYDYIVQDENPDMVYVNGHRIVQDKQLRRAI